MEPVIYIELVFCWRAAKSAIGRILEYAQSILYFMNLVDKPVHVQIRYNRIFDVSAEASGVSFVKHSDLKGRKYEVYRSKIKLDRDKLKKYIGKEYDYFFYIRWWWKISLTQVPIFLVALILFDVLSGLAGLIVLLSYGALWFPVNLILKRLSKNRWACSELAAAVLWDHGSDFGYGTRFSAASPVDEYNKVKFANWELIEKGI